MAVDGAFRNPHLARDQVTDAVLPVHPLHLCASLEEERIWLGFTWWTGGLQASRISDGNVELSSFN